MEVKKLSVVDLEDKKLTNYLIGLVIVIATFYATLEFGTREVVERVYDGIAELLDDIHINSIRLPQQIVWNDACVSALDGGRLDHKRIAIQTIAKVKEHRSSVCNRKPFHFDKAVLIPLV